MPVAARQALQAAAITDGATLDEELQTALAEALVKVSPVDAVVGAYTALKDHVEDLSPALTEGLRKAAETIAANGFHGLAVEAAALAASIAPASPPPEE